MDVHSFACHKNYHWKVHPESELLDNGHSDVYLQKINVTLSTKTELFLTASIPKMREANVVHLFFSVHTGKGGP